MKAKKKTAASNSKKTSKNRLLCVTLSESLLASSKAYGRKCGFSSMSELLRAAIERAPSVVRKKNAPDEKKQISFRLSDALYTNLFRSANQSGQSIARIVRTLLENAPALGVRPKSIPKVSASKRVPAKKKPAKAVSASAKKRVPAAGKTAKTVAAKRKTARGR